MTEIVIQGIGGRMGHVLCDMIAQRDDCCVVAGIDVKDGEQNGISVYDSLEKLNGKGDVVIDFSSPAAVEKALPYCEAHKLPIVVCTTGLSEELQLKVVQLSRTVPVFKSANMSMGINVLSELCKRASAILGVNYDVEIVEQHHHNKLDAPSGTALMLADAINEQNDGAYHYVYDRSSVRPRGAVLRPGRSDHPQAHCLFPQHLCQRRHQRRRVSGKEGAGAVQYGRSDRFDLILALQMRHSGFWIAPVLQEVQHGKAFDTPAALREALGRHAAHSGCRRGMHGASAPLSPGGHHPDRRR